MTTHPLALTLAEIRVLRYGLEVLQAAVHNQLAVNGGAGMTAARAIVGDMLCDLVVRLDGAEEQLSATLRNSGEVFPSRDPF